MRVMVTGTRPQRKRWPLVVAIVGGCLFVGYCVSLTARVAEGDRRYAAEHPPGWKHAAIIMPAELHERLDRAGLIEACNGCGERWHRDMLIEMARTRHLLCMGCYERHEALRKLTGR